MIQVARKGLEYLVGLAFSLFLELGCENDDVVLGSDAGSKTSASSLLPLGPNANPSIIQ